MSTIVGILTFARKRKEIISRTVIILLINIKMSMIVGILTFMSMKKKSRGQCLAVKVGFLFVLFDALRPINNLSVKQGWVFLG